MPGASCTEPAAHADALRQAPREIRVNSAAIREQKMLERASSGAVAVVGIIGINGKCQPAVASFCKIISACWWQFRFRSAARGESRPGGKAAQRRGVQRCRTDSPFCWCRRLSIRLSAGIQERGHSCPPKPLPPPGAEPGRKDVLPGSVAIRRAHVPCGQECPRSLREVGQPFLSASDGDFPVARCWGWGRAGPGTRDKNVR